MKSSHESLSTYLLEKIRAFGGVVICFMVVGALRNAHKGDPIFSPFYSPHRELTVLRVLLAGETNGFHRFEPTNSTAEETCNAVAQQIIDDECSPNPPIIIIGDECSPNPSFEPSETEEARIEDCEVQPEPDSWLTRWRNLGWRLVTGWRRG